MRLLDPPLSIVLPFASPSQNETGRWHWARKKRVRSEVALMVLAAMRQRQIPAGDRADRRMRVEVVRHAPRALDFGNLVGGFKHCLDGLRDAGIIYDDSPRWVDEHYSQTYDMHAYTLVTIAEVQGDACR